HARKEKEVGFVGVIDDEHEDRHHLERGLLFAAASRLHDDSFAHGDDAEGGDRKLPRFHEDDDEYAPERDASHPRKEDERSDHHQLIGEGIEKFAEDRDEPHPAREPSVEEIGDGGDDIDDGGPKAGLWGAVVKEPEDERDERDARHRE